MSSIVETETNIKKSLVKKKVPTYAVCTRKKDFHHYDSYFTSLRGLFDGSKNQRNPMPKHVELQIISAYINQQMLEYALFEEE